MYERFLLVFGSEAALFGIDARGRDFHVRKDRKAITKNRALLRFEREGKLFRLGLPARIRKGFLPERVGGEESVAARVPIGRVTWVARMIEDRERHGRIRDLAPEQRPTPARAPHRIAPRLFAAAVLAPPRACVTRA